MVELEGGPGSGACLAEQEEIPIPVRIDWAGPGTNVMFLLSISKQDQEYLSAPGDNCVCQAGAMSWSGVLIQIQD